MKTAMQDNISSSCSSGSSSSSSIAAHSEIERIHCGYNEMSDFINEFLVGKNEKDIIMSAKSINLHFNNISNIDISMDNLLLFKNLLGKVIHQSSLHTYFH